MKTANKHIAMKRLIAQALAAALWLSAPGAKAQGEWPLVLNGPEARVTIYQPQPIAYNDNVVQLMAAVSVLERGSDEPVFGSIWANALTAPGRDGRYLRIENFRVTESRFPDIADEARIRRLEKYLGTEISRWDLQLSLDQLHAELDMSRTERELANHLRVDPPNIIYRDEYSILVMIDGEPKLKRETAYGLDRVMNTPFTIVRSGDGRYYLHGSGYWYGARSVRGPWTTERYLPASLERVQAVVRENEKEIDMIQSDRPPAIVVSFEPAELIQTDGEAQFAPLEGTGLLYITNSDDDIFVDVASQQYYVLLSGRWFRSGSLYGPWAYVPADRLPVDFSGIREGSAKQMVLAHVAGTRQAHEALLDAQVPQTARVDRHTASANVDYDGNPQFQGIEGTDMSYAVNTALPVLRHRNRYYLVESGVWFVSNSPHGPWAVATRRPASVAYLPPSVPVYNVKYVYIYDVTPDYVWMGYLPGYLGAYVYGPTVVYGTGYHYRPWSGRFYYARPVTWGFAMQYNPWAGWSMGITYSTGWFHFNSWYGAWHGGWCGGWWGPVVYRPPYRAFYAYDYPSYWYGRTVIDNRPVQINNYYTNVYRSRTDVVTRDISRPVSVQPRDIRTSTAASRTLYSRPGTVNNDTRQQSVGNRSAGAYTTGQSRPGSNNATAPASGTLQRTGTRPGSQALSEREGSAETYQRRESERSTTPSGTYSRPGQPGRVENAPQHNSTSPSGQTTRSWNSAEPARETQKATSPSQIRRPASQASDNRNSAGSDNRYQHQTSRPAEQNNAGRIQSSGGAYRSSSPAATGRSTQGSQPSVSRPSPASTGAVSRPQQSAPVRSSGTPSQGSGSSSVNRSSTPATSPARSSGARPSPAPSSSRPDNTRTGQTRGQ